MWTLQTALSPFTIRSSGITHTISRMWSSPLSLSSLSYRHCQTHLKFIIIFLRWFFLIIIMKVMMIDHHHLCIPCLSCNSNMKPSLRLTARNAENNDLQNWETRGFVQKNATLWSDKNMRPYYAVATHCGFEVDSQKDLQAIKSRDENKGLWQITSVAFDL